MRYAFFGRDTHHVDLQRHLLLANALGHEVISDLSVLDHASAAKLLFSDSCDTKTLLKIKRAQQNGKISKVSVIILELFNVDFQAWREELTFLLKSEARSNWKAILYFLLVVPLKIRLIQGILSFGSTEAIIPSQLRVNYLKTRLSQNIVYTVLRNKPILKQFQVKVPIDFESQTEQVKEIVAGGNFIFIGGRINVETEFFTVCAFASQNNLKVLAATGQFDMMQRSVIKFPGLIISLGKISNEFVMYLSSRCLAGLCLYHNATSNQRLSASSKFFEFMLINKTIIASDNPGMLAEVQHSTEPLVIPINKLTEGMKIERTEALINEEYSFENEIEDYKIN
ncbi:hypothetical protein [Daejeonella lutea]|uniref:Glycosyl transferases group 1 n=1 Tax=Daejeonella lutea TaxID=572036 RepID=A0A1T5FBQ1_9SPHI|nr:hypothetical protein [Daejeonella lutea]SKB93518.1 hypothetical protein SAMN05661099_3569 [Daejeonella lutea]